MKHQVWAEIDNKAGRQVGRESREITKEISEAMES